MSKGSFIITGTSRGIGEAITKGLLDDGHDVFGVSRGKSDQLAQYEHYIHTRFDLNETEHIEKLMTNLLKQVKHKEKEMICLINNAAMVEPLKPIEECTAEEINKNLHISLIAPMILSACFIRKTQKLNIKKKIINISSGAGTQPLENMSIYCTAKAGINMFTRCIGVEQAGTENPVEIIGVDPGMVETEMQKALRGKDKEQFPMAKYFLESYINGEVQSLESIMPGIKNMIWSQHESGRIMSHFEE